jgi:hypothetical protein
MRIQILNWEKFNPRKDLKATSWLRLQNSLFEDPAFFEFDHAEICFWIYLLSLASKKQTGSVHFSAPHAERIGRFKKSTYESALLKLTQLQCVQIERDDPIVDDTQTLRARDEHVPLRNERTDETDVTERNVPDVAEGVTPPAPEPKAEPKPKKPPAKTAAVWEAYSAAYRDRYGHEPEDNAKVRSQMAQFISQVGAEDAPMIAAFYVSHNHRFYVDKGHPFGLCLTDTTKLRTEWLSGRQVTGIEARATERKQGTFNAFAGLLKEAEAKESGHGK